MNCGQVWMGTRMPRYTRKGWRDRVWGEMTETGEY